MQSMNMMGAGSMGTILELGLPQLLSTISEDHISATYESSWDSDSKLQMLQVNAPLLCAMYHAHFFRKSTTITIS